WHNRNLLLYHFVCPIKFRRKVLTDPISASLKAVCLEISERYDVYFLEIGTDKDHVHFLIQSIPNKSPSKIMKMVKSLTAREVFKRHPNFKREMWGGKFWSSGYYVNTVGQHANEAVIKQYVQNQGKTYKQLHRNQLTLF
ncbi:MAG: IS200/IS605 family transposase, partial [Bacteroidota bacterium]